MTIQYIEPLSRAITRTKNDLFRPFDLGKWFVVGFTAFLAGLSDIRMSGGFPGADIRGRSHADLGKILYLPQKAWEWLSHNPGWAILIAVLAVLACIIGIVITWVSARGKFMFLDNVVLGQSRVTVPWHEYRKEGNSFFWWNLLWLALFTATVLVYLFYSLRYLQMLYAGAADGRLLIVPAILAGLGLAAISLVFASFYLLLRDFVVPIMYRDRITGLEAIQKFLPLFSSHLLYFIGYVLLLFCLALLIVAGILIFGCVTCCIGFLLLAIPYINAVLLLPVFYTLRAFSVEFLEQFGPEYRVFPRPDVNPPEAEPVSL